jgi:hypothetical protein
VSDDPRECRQRVLRRNCDDGENRGDGAAVFAQMSGCAGAVRSRAGRFWGPLGLNNWRG